MKYIEIIEELEKTNEFKEWHKNSPTAYLVHIFVMMDETNKGLWQIGYLNPKSDRITTFVFNRETVEINPESDILKEPESQIFPLEMEKVELDEKKMLKIINEFTEENYPKIFPLKRFYVLQHLDIGQVFNFTIMTNEFKTLNIKVDAGSGEVLRHSLSELMKVG